MAVKIDEIIRSKRKTVQLTITRDARLVVRAPLRLPMKWINEFVERKSDWIEKNLSRAAARKIDTPARRFLDGEEIYFLGSTYLLSVRADKNRIELGDGLFLFPGKFMDNPKKHLENWYVRQARNYIHERLSLWSGALRIPYKFFRITSARRRWGSCSSKNTLNFTWRLVQAEPDAIDYVIVHELCHVLIKNHSKPFWQLVERALPNYRILRKWLRNHQKLMEL